MSKVILIDPCLDPRWDRFVESHPFGWVAHLSAWKRVLESTFPHMKGHYLSLVDDKGDIQAGLPLFEVRSPITGNRLVSIPFATLCDPLVSQQGQFHVLVQCAKMLLGGLDGGYVEVRAHHSSPLLSDKDLRPRSLYSCHYLDLAPPPELLFRSFHRHGVRYMINKAERYPFELSAAENPAHLREFYELYVCTRRRLGLPPQPYSFFSELWKKLGPRDAILILLARIEGKAVAGLMLFRFRNRMSAEALGLKESSIDRAPSFFLFWEAIKLAREQGCKVFDMGRTALDNHGLMTFKNRWGTKVVDLPQYYVFNGNRPPRPPLSPSLIPALRRVCSRLPMPIFELLGRACYRHMG